MRGDLQSTEQDTYVATLAVRTFRALTAISAAFNLEIRQFDAINVFVHSKLNEDIYCYSLEGYQRAGSCWHLLRVLYGLKQSPQLGLPAIYEVNCLHGDRYLLLFFYVDDITILYSKQHQAHFEQFERQLLQRFDMRSLGELKWFPGSRIERERAARKIWLCQNSYISKIATKFNLHINTKSYRAPLPSEALVAANEEEQVTAQQILTYQQRVGSINFVAVVSRPDIAAEFPAKSNRRPYQCLIVLFLTCIPPATSLSSIQAE